MTTIPGPEEIEKMAMAAIAKSRSTTQEWLDKNGAAILDHLSKKARTAAKEAVQKMMHDGTLAHARLQLDSLADEIMQIGPGAGALSRVLVRKWIAQAFKAHGYVVVEGTLSDDHLVVFSIEPKAPAPEIEGPSYEEGFRDGVTAALEACPEALVTEPLNSGIKAWRTAIQQLVATEGSGAADGA